MIHQENTLGYRLKHGTQTNHDSVDALVMSVKPFDNLENYIRFLQLQAVFHKTVDAVYHNAELNQRIHGLADLARYDDVILDLQDLHAAERAVTLPAPRPEGHQAIGWLYCAEGSNLGAAFLFKEAQRIDLTEQHGARHLAGHPDGRGKHWRRFVDQLNALGLSESEEQAAVEGAREAFAFYKQALREIYEL